MPAGGSNVTTLLTVLAVGLGLTAQQLVRQQPEEITGWWLLVLGAVLMAAVTPPPARVGDPCPALAAPRRSLWWRLPCALAAVLATGGATVLSDANRRPVVVLALWFSAFALGTVALCRCRVTPAGRGSPAWTIRERLLLAAILVLALSARVAWLDAVPPYYFPDEGRVGIFLREAYAARIPNPFIMGWNTWPVIGLSIQGMFGPLLGLSTTSLRLASAVMGTLGVLCTYLLARQLFTPRVAVLAAFLLAICRTAIDFSRLGTCHAQVIFLAPLAFYFWWRAVNTGRGASYFWAGVGLGFCMYTYNAGQLLPVLWVGWILLCALYAPRQVAAYWPGALITVAGFVIAVFPYAYYFTDHFHFGANWGQWTIMARHRQTMDEVVRLWRAGAHSAAGAYLWHQAWLTWLGFSLIPAAAYGLGYRGGGMLDGVTAPLFVFGLTLCTAQLRQPRLAFVPYWWLVTAVFGGVLTIEPPAFVRMVGILPPLALLAAVALDAVFRPAVKTRTGTVVATGLVAAILVGATWANWRTYFVEFGQQPSDQVTAVSRAVRRMPADGAAFLLGSEYDEAGPLPRSQLHFIQEYFLLNFPGRHFQDVPDPAKLVPLHEPIPSSATLILGPSQVTLASYLRTLYPHASIEDYDPGGQLLFRIVHLDHDDLIGRAGLELARYDGERAAEPQTVADPFAADVPVAAANDRRKWTGSIYWPSDRLLTVTARNRVATTVRIAGAAPLVISAGVPVRVSLQLARGWQPIEIDEAGGSQRDFFLSTDDGAVHPFTRWDLRPEPTQQGLAAVYERAGRPPLHAIDPQIDAYAIEGFFRPPNPTLEFAAPFSVAWEGSLLVDDAGTYQFEARGSGPFALQLDGATVFDERRAAPTSPRTVSLSCRLAAGAHALAARWNTLQAPYNTARRMFQLYWTPPHGTRELIPPPRFSPQLPPASAAAEPAICTRSSPPA